MVVIMDMELMPTLRIRNNSNRQVVAVNLFRTCCLLVVVLFSIVLSINSHDYANLKVTKNYKKILQWNIFNKEFSDDVLELPSRILELENAFAFMTWSNERDKLNKKYIYLLKQKLNATPYSSRDWQLLLKKLNDQNIPNKEISWVLMNAIELNKWKISDRPWLASYCLVLNEKLNQSVITECYQLMQALESKSNLMRLATLMGYTQEQLDVALNDFNKLNVYQ